MALIKCPECGKEISDKAAFCPSCGYVLKESVQKETEKEKIKNKKVKKKDSKLSIAAAIFALFTWFWWLGLILAIIDLVKNKNDEKRHIGSWFAVIMAIIMVILPFIPASTENEERVAEMNAHDKRNEVTEENTEIKKSSETEQEELNIEISEQEKSVDEMTEEEYKEQCEKLWYDDIFFSEDDLEGHHVRLEVYVEESKFFDAEAIYDENTANFINEYNLQRDLFACGVSRGELNSYVGGQIYVYFSDDYGYKQLDYETGQELIIYGEIVQYSTNTWDGYNVCGLVPRYIEKK